jgi:hypothetical protein
MLRYVLFLLMLIFYRCFGFDTAVEESQRALLAAKVEASSARKGIGERQAAHQRVAWWHRCRQ